MGSGGSKGRMGKKNPTATCDDVSQAKAEIEKQIRATKAEIEKAFADQLAEAQKKIDADVEKVRQSLQELDAAKLNVDSYDKLTENTKEQVAEAAAELRQEMGEQRQGVEVQIKAAQEDLEGQITTGDDNVSASVAEELGELCTRFDEMVASVRRALEELIGSRRAEAADNLQKSRQELESLLEQARQQASDTSAEVQRVGREELEVYKEAQELVDKKQDQKAKNVQTDNNLIFADTETKIQARADEASAALDKAAEHAASELQQATEESIRRFEAVEEQIDQLQISFNDVQNVPTRKVEWVIRNADSRLRLPVLKPSGGIPSVDFQFWKSPPFDAAGAKGMCLELQLYRPCDPPEEGQDHGDCAVLLHAPKGTQIAFTLSIGSAKESFEYKFNSDKPLGSQRLCFIKEQVESLTGNLRIGLEVLECIYEFEKAVPKPEEVEEDEAEKKAGKKDAEKDEPPLDSFFGLQRHTNNRILDQVKMQMDYFKNRNTRKIEWRLEQASLMKRSFPRGAPMTSKLFDAAGIAGLQLLFYPSGANGCGEGFCSAYVLAPAGTTLKSTLQVGAERRDINFTFEKAGQLGKVNFCRFENCVDEETDSILVVFDIEEAHVELHARMHHCPPAQVGARSFAKPKNLPIPLGSTVKIQRANDSLPAILKEVKVLPSLWTAKNNHEAAVTIDGFGSSIKDLKKRAQSGALRPSPSSPALH